MRLSIHRRLLLPLALLFLMGMVVLVIAARAYGREAANRSYDHLLQASALSITDSLRLIQGQWEVDIPYAALEVLQLAPEDRAFYGVADENGNWLTGYADLPRPPRLPASDREPVLFDAAYRGEKVRFIVMTHHVAGPERVSNAWVQVGQTRLARDLLANDLVWRATLLILLLTVGALTVVWIGVNVSLRPLRRLESELRRREASDLSAIGLSVPKELDHLVGALNHFMGRLKDNLDGLRVFISDAAHQLRTPLAALLAQAQVAADEDDPIQQKRSLAAIERNAGKLSRLVNQLLSDASVNHRSTLQRYERLDLRDVVYDALRESIRQAEPRPDVRCRLGENPALIVGDAFMLREAFKNLFDNAQRYGSPNGETVEVELIEVGRRWQLLILDRGQGIEPAQAQTIFERFARGNGHGQAQHNAPTGAGLGLAIVQRVVLSHSGRVDLSNRPDGGLLVCIEIPAA